MGAVAIFSARNGQPKSPLLLGKTPLPASFSSLPCICLFLYFTLNPNILSPTEARLTGQVGLTIICCCIISSIATLTNTRIKILLTQLSLFVIFMFVMCT